MSPGRASPLRGMPAERAPGEARRERLRRRVLRSLGADAAAQAELLAYGANTFDASGLARFAGPPLPDEPFVETWRAYARVARRVGAAACLRERLVQLQFPIREGMSRTEAYRLATRSGVRPPNGTAGLELERPEDIELRIHRTAAGRIPVITVGHRPDFVALVRALARRNEPEPIPPAVGALMVAGYNNWDRVAALREAWLRADPGRRAADWAVAFRELLPQKELYQDRIILLCAGPYSGVPAESLRLGAEEWSRLSLTIRLEHECTHYFTRRVFGSMRNALLDELIADYAGIVAAAGRFRADWFLRFMGLDGGDDASPRTGARIEVYRGSPPLSDAAFAVLCRVVRLAALQLEAYERCRFGIHEVRTVRERTAMVAAIAGLTLEALASRHAHALLDRAVESLPDGWRPARRRRAAGIAVLEPAGRALPQRAGIAGDALPA